MVIFVLLLVFFTNLNYVTLENKVNIALTAELQFNQNDIKDLDRLQKYLGEIKRNILQKNLRKHNSARKYKIKNNEVLNVDPIKYKKKNIHKYPKLKKNKYNNARRNRADIDVSIAKEYIKKSKEDVGNFIQNSSKHHTFTKTTIGKQVSKDIHIHDVHNKLIIYDSTPKLFEENLTEDTSKHDSSIKTTVSKQISKDIHIHDVENKLIIYDSTPAGLERNLTEKTKIYDSTPARLERNLTEKTSEQDNPIKSTVGKQISKDIHIHDVQNKLIIYDSTPKVLERNVTKNTSTQDNSIKTTLGKQISKDIHIHDVNNKFIIYDTLQQSTKDTQDHNNKAKPKMSNTNVDSDVLSGAESTNKKSKVEPTTLSTKITSDVLREPETTNPPNARKHGLTTVKNKRLIISATEKSKSQLQKQSTKYHMKDKEKRIKDMNYPLNEANVYYNNLVQKQSTKHIKEKGKRIKDMNYALNEANVYYNNLDEYFKARVKKGKDDKNKEVLEKIKLDLGNLFSEDKTSTSENPDSFQELEKAFGFDM